MRALAIVLALATAAVCDEALTHNRRKDWSPAVSPDGKTLVYLSKRGNTDLWAMEVASRKERRLTDSPEREKGMRFSPDGGRLAFLILRDLVHRVQVLDMRSGVVHELGPGEDAAWSPDGKQIASRDEKGLFLIDAASGKRRRLAAASRAGIGSIRWSRKEEAIFYLHEGDLWKVAPAGSAGPEKLFSGKEEDSRANFIYFRPSPGESRFVAVVDLSRLSIRYQDEGVLLDERNKKRRRLGPMERAVWTPGGKALVFCRGGNVHRLALDERTPQCIAGEDNVCRTPVVSRDGTWVYFSARNPERRGSGGRIPSRYTEIYRARLP